MSDSEEEIKNLLIENAVLKAKILVIQEEIKNACEAICLMNAHLALDHLNKARTLTAQHAILEIENIITTAHSVVRYNNLQETENLQIALTKLGQSLCNEKLEKAIKSLMLIKERSRWRD